MQTTLESITGKTKQYQVGSIEFHQKGGFQLLISPGAAFPKNPHTIDALLIAASLTPQRERRFELFSNPALEEIIAQIQAKRGKDHYSVTSVTIANAVLSAARRSVKHFTLHEYRLLWQTYEAELRISIVQRVRTPNLSATLNVLSLQFGLSGFEEPVVYRTLATKRIPTSERPLVELTAGFRTNICIPNKTDFLLHSAIIDVENNRIETKGEHIMRQFLR